jgi:hypothetical protein
MPVQKSSRARRAVNPAPIDVAKQVLQFAKCGLAVLPRIDIGAVSIKARDREGGVEILLAPRQARAVIELMAAAVLIVEDAESLP